MKNFLELWNDFKALPFPDNVTGMKLPGINPISIKASASACIESYVKSGNISPEQKRVLDRCLTDMRELNPKLMGEAQVYFGKLYRLCDLVNAQT